MILSRSISLLVVVALLAATPVRADDGKVTGSVNVSGKPLAAGKIIFHLADGQFVGAKVKDGSYTIDRVPVGARKITVEGKGVPAKYASEDTSALTLEVKKGNAMFDLDLR